MPEKGRTTEGPGLWTGDVLGSAKRQRYIRKPCDYDTDRLAMPPEVP